MLRAVRHFLFGPSSVGGQAKSAVDWHPDWLAHMLMTDEFPWDDAQSTTMTDFLDRYSLHDSYWTGLWLIPGQALVAIIRWEVPPYAFEGPEWHSVAGRAGPYPVLVLRFPLFYRLDQEVPGEVPDPWLYISISHAESRQLQESEIRTVLWPPDGEREYEHHGAVCETTIWGVERYRVRVLHGRDVSVLLFTDSGERIAVPDL